MSDLGSPTKREYARGGLPRSLNERPTVILSKCTQYDVEEIRAHTLRALRTLRLTPFGRTLIKPNVVASGERFPHAYTRPEVVEGVARALKERAAEAPAEGAGLPPVREWAIGERCGITIPTRFAYEGAGYYPMAARVGFTLHHFDECTQVETPLTHPGRLRDALFMPEPIVAADFFVNCPKFKAHPWTTVTFSLKNYIGTQDDRHRLIDHDHKLNEKILDLQHVIQPQLIVIDAITAGEGRMLTPIPFDLGLLLFGDNQVAFDAVCCAIIGVDPLSVPHIRLAHEAGFGPVDLAEINVVGDLEAARRAAAGFRVGLVRVEEYFAGTSIRAYGGLPPRDPAGGGEDYCWGGCPGALEEAIEILRLYDAHADRKLPPTHIVFGRYEGPLDVREGERVVFVGDCAEFKGEVGGELVQVESTYRDRATLNPREARTEDIFHKMFKMYRLTSGAPRVLTLRGCPVSVAEQVLLLVRLGGLKNPYLDPAQALSFVSCYLSWRGRQLLRRVLGQPAQRLIKSGDEGEGEGAARG
ncbi:MAG: DUF362 domain-containing protein [Deltaproteobacteria bacterium]|nr:DUF362 domain-containing protein [Deltaproteobacteria bacterium]